MNIETLRIFCDVVQHQSFSRGAKINEVSQSAATQSVHRVEEHFGVQLVDRSKRPFVLTARRPGLLRRIPRGPRAVRVGRSAGAVVADGDQRTGARGGDLFRRPARHEPLHAGLHAADIPRPRCGWSICGPTRSTTPCSTPRWILGIVSYPAGVARSGCDSLAFRADGGGLSAGTSAGASARPSRPNNFEGVDFVGFDRDLSIRKEIDRHMRQRSVNIHVVMEFDNIETIKQAVRDRRRREHPARADDSRRGPAAARWRPFAWSRRSCTGRSGIIHRQRKVFTPTAAKFVELLQQVQSQPPEEHVMRDPEVLVCFRPSGREAYVLPGHAVGRSGRRGGYGAGRSLRRRRALRQVPRDRRRGRRRTQRRGTRLASRPKNFTPAGGWRANRPCRGRRKSRFRPRRGLPREHKILVHAAGTTAAGR